MAAAPMKTRIAPYERTDERAHCPDCGAPLLVAYEAEARHGLQVVLTCAADCGYQQPPVRIVHGHSGQPTAA